MPQATPMLTEERNQELFKIFRDFLGKDFKGTEEDLRSLVRPYPETMEVSLPLSRENKLYFLSVCRGSGFLDIEEFTSRLISDARHRIAFLSEDRQPQDLLVLAGSDFREKSKEYRYCEVGDTSESELTLHLSLDDTASFKLLAALYGTPLGELLMYWTVNEDRHRLKYFDYNCLCHTEEWPPQHPGSYAYALKDPVIGEFITVFTGYHPDYWSAQGFSVRRLTESGRGIPEEYWVHPLD